MAQVTTDRTPTAGYVGDVADGSGKCDWISRNAAEEIDFGDWLVEDSTGESVRKPMQNVYTITLDADFVTSNSITGALQYRQLDDASFTSETIGPVAFNSDHDTTMDDLVTELEAELATPLGSTGSVELTDASNNRQITITLADGYELKGDTALAVTGGAGQAGVTEAGSTADAIVGIAVFQHRQPNTLATESASYAKNSDVRVGVGGTFWVRAEGAVTTSTTPYARVLAGAASDEFRGQTMNAAGSVGVAVQNAKFRSSAADGALSKITVNKP